MAYYPININLASRSCLVVGGGRVAARKIKTLLDFDAFVKTVAPSASPDIEKLAEDKRIKLIRRKFRRSDLEGITLAFAATDDPSLNKKVAIEAGKKGILVNVVDDPDFCTFILPAVIRRGNLVISISTSGSSPSLAKKLRLEIEKLIPPGAGEDLQYIEVLRRKIREKFPDPKERENFWKKFWEEKR